MVGKIASRKAGINLLAIIILLLLPIVLFGASYVREARRDIAAIELELKGLALANQAVPVLLGKQVELSNGQKLKLAVDESRALGSNPDLSIETVLAAQNSIALSQESRTHLANSYIQRVIERSGLILDDHAETFFLILSVLNNLPALLDDYHKVNARLMVVRQQAAGPNPTDMTPLLITFGHANEALERLVSSLESASGATHDPASHDEFRQIASELQANVNGLGTQLRRSQAPGGLAAIAQDDSAGLKAKILVGTSERLWTQATAKIESLLLSRRNALQRGYYLLLAAGVASALIGLGTAFLMFRRTLGQLDDVQDARAAEHAARVEAESMTAKLSDMHEGVIALNRDLASNLAQLKSAQEELLKKGRMEQLGQLTATIAHELRNPLGAVRTSAFLLERKTRDKNLGVETQLERINSGVVRCDNIITQLLDFSRSRKLQTKPDILDTWLAKVVEEAARGLPAAVQVDCILGTDEAEIPFDGARLERALLNLISNASEAMVGNGSNPVKLTVDAPKITVRTVAETDAVRIEVSDNGPGISPENMLKIRDPLFTTKSFGTGLGIPAVEQILEQHDGRLDIWSEAGKGARFTLVLPRAHKSEAA